MADDTLEKIAEIEKKASPYIDGKVLATALKLAYFTGMKREEILSLQIQDILDSKGAIVTEIKSCAKTVQGKELKLILTNDVRAILRDYLAYIKKNGYCLKRLSPVFPQKNGAKYGEGKLTKDLAKTKQLVTFETVRQAGLHRVFSEPQDSNDLELKYGRVAIYARTQIKSIKKLFGYYRQTGTRYAPEDEVEQEIFPPDIRDPGRHDDDFS